MTSKRKPGPNGVATIGLCVAAVTASLLTLSILALPFQRSAAQQPRSPKSVSLSSLTTLGYEIKAATGTQSGVVSMLVLQKDQDVYLCEASDLSIRPTAFSCWPVK